MNTIGEFELRSSVKDSDAAPELFGATHLATQVIGGTTYVYVAAADDDGIQILTLSDTGKLKAVGFVDDNDAELGLDGIARISTVTIGETSFLYASSVVDSAVTVFRIEDGSEAEAGSLTHVETYFNTPIGGQSAEGKIVLEWNSYNRVQTVGDSAYLLTTALTSDALGVFKIAADGTLKRTDAAFNADSQDLRLDGAYGLTSHQIGQKTFVFVGSADDFGISVFELSAAGKLNNVFNVKIGENKVGDIREIVVMDVGEATYAFVLDEDYDTVRTYEVSNGGALTLLDQTPLELGEGFSVLSGMTSLEIEGTPFLLLSAARQDGIVAMAVQSDGSLEVVESIIDSSTLDGSNDLIVEQMGDRTFVLTTAKNDGRITVHEIGAGDDALAGSMGDDRMAGQAGDDDLVGRAGDDWLSGGTGDDVLSGHKGADILLGGAGKDILLGGDGDDLLNGGSNGDLLIGGGGKDTADYSSSGGAVKVNLAAGTGIGGHASGDSFLEIESLIGSRFKDDLRGDGAGNKLTGLAGNDVMYGGAGADKMFGNNGADKLFGDGGKDKLDGGGGSDTLKGGAGNDKIIGGKGNDRLFGDAGNDKMLAGGGNDRLVADAGADTLTGGAGSDTFIFADGLGRAFVTDFATGKDVIDLSGMTGLDTFADVMAAADTRNGNTIIQFGDTGDDTITLKGVMDSALGASDFDFG